MERRPSAPRENKMGVQPVGKLLAGMAIPMMISMLVQAFYNIVDSIFVAQLSEDALNAVSLAFPLQNLMIAFGAGTAVGINALLSRSLGEKNQAMADRAANTGIFLSLCSFVVFALIGIFLSRPFFEVQAAGEPVIVDAHPPTVTGLALALGFTGRQALLNYQAKKQFVDTITRAKSRCEEYAESRLFDRDGARGAQFSLEHNFRWNADDPTAQALDRAAQVLKEVASAIN